MATFHIGCILFESVLFCKLHANSKPSDHMLSGKIAVSAQWLEKGELGTEKLLTLMSV